VKGRYHLKKTESEVTEKTLSGHWSEGGGTAKGNREPLQRGGSSMTGGGVRDPLFKRPENNLTSCAKGGTRWGGKGTTVEIGDAAPWLGRGLLLNRRWTGVDEALWGGKRVPQV